MLSSSSYSTPNHYLPASANTKLNVLLIFSYFTPNHYSPVYLTRFPSYYTITYQIRNSLKHQKYTAHGSRQLKYTTSSFHKFTELSVKIRWYLMASCLIWATSSRQQATLARTVANCEAYGQVLAK